MGRFRLCEHVPTILSEQEKRRVRMAKPVMGYTICNRRSKLNVSEEQADGLNGW